MPSNLFLKTYSSCHSSLWYDDSDILLFLWLSFVAKKLRDKGMHFFSDNIFLGLIALVSHCSVICQTCCYYSHLYQHKSGAGSCIGYVCWHLATFSKQSQYQFELVHSPSFLLCVPQKHLAHIHTRMHIRFT